MTGLAFHKVLTQISDRDFERFSCLWPVHNVALNVYQLYHERVCVVVYVCIYVCKQSLGKNLQEFKPQISCRRTKKFKELSKFWWTLIIKKAPSLCLCGAFFTVSVYVLVFDSANLIWCWGSHKLSFIGSGNDKKKTKTTWEAACLFPSLLFPKTSFHLLLSKFENLCLTTIDRTLCADVKESLSC